MACKEGTAKLRVYQIGCNERETNYYSLLYIARNIKSSDICRIIFALLYYWFNIVPVCFYVRRASVRNIVTVLNQWASMRCD